MWIVQTLMLRGTKWKLVKDGHILFITLTIPKYVPFLNENGNRHLESDTGVRCATLYPSWILTTWASCSDMSTY